MPEDGREVEALLEECNAQIEEVTKMRRELGAKEVMKLGYKAELIE